MVKKLENTNVVEEERGKGKCRNCRNPARKKNAKSREEDFS